MKFNFFILLSLFTYSLSAQIDSTKNYAVGITLGHGFVISHSSIVNFLANRRTSQQELYVERSTFKNKSWHKNHNFPTIGVALTRFSLNNSQNIGSVYALSPYSKFGIIQGKKGNLKISSSFGLGFIEKPFKAEDNFKNAAIGSRFNLFISLRLIGEVNLYKALGLNYGLGISHFSNGGFKTPNLGLNIVNIYSGLYYKFGPTVSIKKIPKTEFKKQTAYWYINTGFGLNELNPPGGRKYFAQALFIKREKRVSTNSSIGGGLDFFYNAAHIDDLESQGVSINTTENVQMALSASHVLHFGKFDFTSQLSFYLRNKNTELGSLYHVLGGRWNFNNTYSSFFALKTHISKAEYLLLGIGIKLKNEK